ncbi:hypothetical protein [Amycolatopsis sp. NPDC057786]|uniref:hypothetical protein n=1 Tax=Amycolatopsis sp. NPDC057786 TaxID=3346250 RepID=UPI00366A772A
MGRARTAFAEVVDDPGPGLDVERDHCTVHGTGVQVRLGKDGLWYPYRDQWPAGPAGRLPDASSRILQSELDHEENTWMPSAGHW